jgi:WD40 repeat protein
MSKISHHSSAIWSIGLQGKDLAASAGSEDMKVVIWKRDSKDPTCWDPQELGKNGGTQHTSIITGVYTFELKGTKYIATSDIEDEIYIWSLADNTPIANISGDLLWVGLIQLISPEPVAVVLDPEYKVRV